MQGVGFRVWASGISAVQGLGFRGLVSRVQLGFVRQVAARVI